MKIGTSVFPTVSHFMSTKEHLYFKVMDSPIMYHISFQNQLEGNENPKKKSTGTWSS